MNVAKSLKVFRWIEANRLMIERERPTHAQISVSATKALGFKVSTGPIRDAMAECGIETKRVSKSAAQIQSLSEEIKKLKTLITKLVSSPEIPAWLISELSAIDLGQEGKAALERMARSKNQKVA